jgi:hypothetical protein
MSEEASSGVSQQAGKPISSARWEIKDDTLRQQPLKVPWTCGDYQSSEHLKKDLENLFEHFMGYELNYDQAEE